MRFRKAILTLCALVLLPSKMARAEEQHSIQTALSSTTLSGYVDTSASWWVGSQNLPGLANDRFADAVAIDAGQVSVPTTLTNATLEVGEPVREKKTGSIWHKWIVPASGVARISYSEPPTLPTPAANSATPALSPESIFYPWGGISWGPGGGGGGVFLSVTETWTPGIYLELGYRRWWTRLAAYRGDSMSGLTVVQAGSDLQFDVVVGETIWIALEVEENHPAFEGEPELPSNLPQQFYVDLTTAPSNDSFTSTLSVADTSGGMFTGHALAATREPGEPDLGAEYSGGSIWFHYTAAIYGTVSLSDASQHVSLAVFTGSDVSNLQLVAKSSAGGIAFFAEEGKTYHIALYGGPGTIGFYLTYHGPQYRLFETAVDDLFPNDLTPRFYGVRGQTMLLYAKTAASWKCVEIEPIVETATELLIQPGDAVDGKLRVITVDEAFPSPRVVLRQARGQLVPDLVGIPGQTCAVSVSSDLMNWSAAEVYTLQSPIQPLQAINAANPAHFYRITQSLPVASGPKKQLEPLH